MFSFLRNPLGTQVPGTTTLFPLRSSGAKYASPRAKKGAHLEMSRHPIRRSRKKEKVRSGVGPQAAFQGSDEQ